MSPAFSLFLALAGPPLAESPTHTSAAVPAAATKPTPPSLELLLFVGQGLDQLPYLPAKPKSTTETAAGKVSLPAQENTSVARLGSKPLHPQSVQDTPSCVTASCSR